MFPMVTYLEAPKTGAKSMGSEELEAFVAQGVHADIFAFF